VKRRLFNVFAGVSFVLSIAVLCLWVRSRRHVDMIGYGGSGSGYWQRAGWVASGASAFSCEWWLRQNDPRNPRDWDPQGWDYTTWTISPLFFRRNQFEYLVRKTNIAQHSDDGRPVPPRIAYSHDIVAPHWFVLLILLLPLMLWSIDRARWQRMRRRIRNVQCHFCGYDLRATPDRCPECGMIPSN